MQSFTYTLSANQEFPITSAGSMVACLDATASFEVATDNVAPIAFRQGLQIRYPDRFNQVRIINGSSAQTVTLLIGDGDAALPIPSVVEVVDGAVNRTKNDESFVFSVGSGSSASNYAHVMLRNVSDTHDLVVRRFEIIDLAGASAYDVSLLQAGFVSPLFESYAFNKRLGGAVDSVGQVSGKLSTSLLSVNSGFWTTNTITANVPIRFEFDDPLILEPGNGVLIECQTVNRYFVVNWDYWVKAQ